MHSALSLSLDSRHVNRQGIGGLHKQKVVLLLSGGNIDVNIIARVIEKGLVQEGRGPRLSYRPGPAWSTRPGQQYCRGAGC